MTFKHRKYSRQFLQAALLLLILSLFFPSDTISRNTGSWSVGTAIFQSGDIIFRRGISLISQMVLLADSRSPYSHTGIIKTENEKIFVIHSVPAEEKWETDKVKKELLEDFLRKDRASAIGLYRLNGEFKDSVIRNAILAAEKFAIENTPFDGGFDLDDNTRIYCTELIWKSFLEAGLDLINNKFDELAVPLGKGQYILPSTILESEQLTYIYSKQFK